MENSQTNSNSDWRGLRGKRAAVVLFSYYPADPRPRRACQAMLDAGMEVDLICLRQDYALAREITGGLTVTRVPQKRSRGSKYTYLFEYFQFFLQAFALLAWRSPRRRYSVVHVHNMPDFLVFTALIPRLFGAKLILDMHDPMPELCESIYGIEKSHLLVRILKSLEKWCLRFADLVLTPNLAFKNLFAARSCPDSKIRIIMNSPREELFNPRLYPNDETPPPSGPRPFRLIYHGLLAERHGLDIAIRAVCHLRKDIPNLRFDIYGERTSYADKMVELIHELKMEETVVYHGYKYSSEIARAISTADVGIIPNRDTPFTRINMPTRIFELLAMNKPVIAPRTQGVRDYFDDSDILFFTPDSMEDLERVILWAYQHGEETAKIMERGRQIYLRNNWHLVRNKFLNCVDEMLNQ